MKTTTQLTLDDVKQQFDDWRTRKKPGSKIPEALWKPVRQLIKSSHYKRTTVLRTLGISSAQFTAKFGVIPNSKNYNRPSELATQKTFINAPLDALSTAPNVRGSTIELERADGMKLSLSQLTDEQFSQLLNQFTR